MEILVRRMNEEDYDQVFKIYIQGIETENATFEEEPPEDWESWQNSKINSCSLVATAEGKIVGWATLSRVSYRKAFSGVAEVSIYIANKAKGKGVGSKLLGEIIEVSEKNNIWILQSGIFPENKVSLNLHYKHGFREVGYREKMGQMTYGKSKNKWRSIIILERRSKIVGVEE